MAEKELSPDMLNILRCPEAVHYTDKGDDPGKLTLVGDGYWLHCADNDYKYPILDGIPVMLIDEGKKWKDTAIEDLPIPPPSN